MTRVQNFYNFVINNNLYKANYIQLFTVLLVQNLQTFCKGGEKSQKYYLYNT